MLAAAKIQLFRKWNAIFLKKLLLRRLSLGYKHELSQMVHELLEKINEKFVINSMIIHVDSQKFTNYLSKNITK